LGESSLVAKKAALFTLGVVGATKSFLTTKDYLIKEVGLTPLEVIQKIAEASDE
jgi:hypothetical protein